MSRIFKLLSSFLTKFHDLLTQLYSLPRRELSGAIPSFGFFFSLLLFIAPIVEFNHIHLSVDLISSSSQYYTDFIRGLKRSACIISCIIYFVYIIQFFCSVTMHKSIFYRGITTRENNRFLWCHYNIICFTDERSVSWYVNKLIINYSTYQSKTIKSIRGFKWCRIHEKVAKNVEHLK